MLATQNYLRSGGTLKGLEDEFNIKITHHPYLPLCILNYSQTDSKPRNHEIVRNCRQLILEKHDSWRIVARSFRRFFNVGEYEDEFVQFDWNGCFSQEKLDGSLFLLYNYMGSWMVSTRSTFADGPINPKMTDRSWENVFWSIVDKEKVEKFLNPNISYTMELCTKFNPIVTPYPTDRVYLLASHYGEIELSQRTNDWTAKNIGVMRPEMFHFKNLSEVEAFVRGKEETDPAYEGVILVSQSGDRWKYKSNTYKALARLHENGNIARYDRIVEIILKGSMEKVLHMEGFERYRPEFEEVKEKLDQELTNLMLLWQEVRGISPQKDFALAIVGKTKFTSLLFNARKLGKCPSELWQESPDLITKILFTNS